MKIVILAGGYGTRLSEYTSLIPKPMVNIGDKPIIWHIMNIYSNYGFNDFILALGYKGNKIKEFFLNYKTLNSDFSINLKSGLIHPINSIDKNWNITLVDTGLNTATGGRVNKLKDFIGNETFMLTYGDGVANIDIKKLVKFHKSHGKLATLTAVRPAARFGELDLLETKVLSFKEKPQLRKGWINGGFFVLEPDVINYISGDDVMFEREPLSKISSEGELQAFFHEGFWQSMDTKREHDILQKCWDEGNPPWISK